jgi:DNA polymerase V
MEREVMYKAAYDGSKQFSQHDVRHANATGFGAAADDYMERGIDLNEQLILNKPATFFFRMNGEAMTGASIQSGDVLIVDRSVKATNGKIIVAAVNGDLVVRRLQQSFNRVSLIAENNGYANIELEEFTEYKPWGVVTCVIHIFERSLLAVTNNNLSRQKKKDDDYRVLY